MLSRRRGAAGVAGTVAGGEAPDGDRGVGRAGRRPLRVGLYGGFGTGNTGNDATAAVAVEHLRATHPDLDLRLITYGPQTAAVAERLGVPTVSTQPAARSGRGHGADLALVLPGAVRSVGARAGRLVREAASTWTTLRSVDAVVVLGCGIFEAESTVGGRGWRAMADLYLVSLASSLGSHRLAFVGVGGTELPTRAERALVVAAMRRAERRSFRDEASKTALARMGGGHRDDLVVADLVFAADFMDVDSTGVDSAGVDSTAGDVTGVDLPAATDTDARPLVALGVMAFDWLRRSDGRLSPQDPYLAALVETATTLVRQGQDVVIFAGDVADRFAVDLVADETRARLGSDGDRVTTVHATSLPEQVPVLTGARTVVGSRFHNAVTALMVGRAPIAVLDRTKVRTLMHTMGLDDHVLEARTLAAPDLIDLVARAQAEQETTERRTTPAVRAARAHALRGLVDLDRLVERWGAPAAPADRVGAAVSSGGSVA